MTDEDKKYAMRLRPNNWLYSKNTDSRTVLGGGDG